MPKPHRGDVAKMLVRRSARRQGIAMQLLVAIENVARDLGLLFQPEFCALILKHFDVLTIKIFTLKKKVPSS